MNPRTRRLRRVRRRARRRGLRYPLVTGTRITYTSLRVTIDGREFTGIRSLSYGVP